MDRRPPIKRPKTKRSTTKRPMAKGASRTFEGARRWLRRHGGIGLLGCLVFCSTFLLTLVVLDRIDPRPARGGGQDTPSIAAAPAEQKLGKFDHRTEAAVTASLMAQPEADLSGLPAFELSGPFTSLSGTRFMRGGDVVILDGVEGPPFEEVCRDETGARWACGLQARAALHNQVRGRTLVCRPRKAVSLQSFSAECVLKGQDGQSEQDLAGLLVRLGWARPERASDRFSAERAEARKQKAGLWRGDWTVAVKQ